MQRTVTCLWKEPAVRDRYRTGVSLHSHTNRSREGLTFISNFAARHRFLRQALAGEDQRSQRIKAVPLDFEKAYWSPPLPPLPAFMLERDQIEQELGLDSMVSITDHDNIEAPMSLRVVPEARRIPVSVEWTVPFQNAIFHLGVHNLPSARAESTMAMLREFTQAPVECRLSGLMRALDEIPDVLLVLNHPMWDLSGIGADAHRRTLTTLLCEYGEFLHALELNGMRGWKENQDVLHLSQSCNQIVISGGDRHGCEPNAALNLTNAQSFSEFVHETRKERRSHVLFMPQYHEHFTLRVFQNLLDVIREYPDYAPGSRRWDERVFHPDSSGQMRPLAAMWRRPPFYVRYFFSAVRLLEMDPVRTALRSTFAKPQRQEQFAFADRQESAP